MVDFTIVLLPMRIISAVLHNIFELEYHIFYSCLLMLQYIMQHFLTSPRNGTKNIKHTHFMFIQDAFSEH